MKAFAKHLYMLVIILFAQNVEGQSQFSDSFSDSYFGLEIGTISYNTQITFDGVNDPAGRGGFGYGAFVGHNFLVKKLMVGGELFYNLVNEPDPYTFDPSVTGFADLEIKRNASYGLELRSGIFLTSKLLFYGSLGYSRNKQTVVLDGDPLDQFSGGAETESFGRILAGFGLEVTLTSVITLRFAFETTEGHDLNKSDFGIVATNASLQRLDVEPSIQQFFIGTIYRL